MYTNIFVFKRIWLVGMGKKFLSVRLRISVVKCWLNFDVVMPFTLFFAAMHTFNYTINLNKYHDFHVSLASQQSEKWKKSGKSTQI